MLNLKYESKKIPEENNIPGLRTNIDDNLHFERDEKELFKAKKNRNIFNKSHASLAWNSSKKNISTYTNTTTALTNQQIIKVDKNYLLYHHPTKSMDSFKVIEKSMSELHKKQLSLKEINDINDNKNSVLAKFRKNLLFSKKLVENEIEKIKKIRLKNSNSNFHNDKIRTSQNNPAKSKFFKTMISVPQLKLEGFTSPALCEPSKSSFRSQEDRLQILHKDADKKSITVENSPRSGADSRKQLLKNISRRKKIVRNIQTGSMSSLRQNLHTIEDESDNRIDTEPSHETVAPLKVIRTCRYQLELQDNWKSKAGLVPLFKKYSNHVIEDIQFQSNAIIDEIKVLLDSIQQYKLHYLAGTAMLECFRNMDTQKQTRYNKFMEETCILLGSIPKILLKEFHDYLHQFIALPDPIRTGLLAKKVTSEEQCFIENARLLSDVSNFIKCSYEVYSIIVKQVDDMVITVMNFSMLMEYLEKARFNISYLIRLSKNSMENLHHDQYIVKKYIDILPIHKKKETFEQEKEDDYENISDTIKKQFKYKLNEENQRKFRLNNILTAHKDGSMVSFSKKRQKLTRKFRLQSILVKIKIYFVTTYRALI